MKILVTGASGQVAQELQAADKDGLCHFWGRDRLDLFQTDRIAATLAQQEFDVLVNAAAYTAVDKAEDEVDAADALNHIAAGILSDVAAQKGVPIIHISTDYVFDGTKAEAYKPDDETNPQSVYGHTKLAGEHAVIAANPKHVILRTAWVYSQFGNNFVKTMLRLADREELGVVDDQRGCPTSAADIAKAILAMAANLDEDAPWGIYHFVGQGETSWARFADEIFDQALKMGLIASRPKVKRIGTADYPTPAKRPHNSALNCATFDQNFKINRTGWRSSLRIVLEHLSSAGAENGS